MKKINRPVSLVLVLIFLFSSALTSSAAVVNDSLPVSEQTAGLKWEIQLGTSYRNAPNMPCVDGDFIYVMSGKTLYKLNKSDGATVNSVSMSLSPAFLYISVLIADGKIFCPLDDGTVEAYDSETLNRLWTFTDSLYGQSMANMVYDNGKIYTGFWNNEDEDASFVCIDGETGKADWSFVHKGGFYWTECAVFGNYLIIGGDDGITECDGKNELYCVDKNTGKITDSVDITGDQRSGITRYGDRFFFTSKCGYLYSVEMSDGVFSDLKSLALGGQSTSTPVILNDRLYVGVSNQGKPGGKITVVDSNSLTEIYSADVKGYPQNEMLVTQYCGDVYVYTTYNAMPGGIAVMKDSEGQISSEVSDLFVPTHAGFSISPLVSDSDGTIYYKNDSGYIFAVENTDDSMRIIGKIIELLKKIIAFIQMIKSMFI